MNGHHPPIETDPLGAIRKELLSAAWRQKARRDRNRRVATITSSFVLLLASIAGGASALGVDLPLIGDALRPHSERQAVIEDAGPGGLPSQVDVKPGGGNASGEVGFPWPSGRTAVGAAYLNTRDQMCVVFVAPGRKDIDISGCAPPASIIDRVDEGVVYIQGVSVRDEGVVVTGYVSRDVESVEVTGPAGSLQARLSDLWSPRAAGGEPLRVFFATAAPSSEGRSLDGDLATRMAVPGQYEARARLRDGRTISVRP